MCRLTGTTAADYSGAQSAISAKTDDRRMPVRPLASAQRILVRCGICAVAGGPRRAFLSATAGE